MTNIKTMAAVMKSFMTRLLYWIFDMSPCCGARREYSPGWNRMYCAKCHKRLR